MRQRGFTLVELIIVITLLGIISLVTVGFITSSVQGYADLKKRDQLSSSARVAVERIAREVRNALPNSIRVKDGQCLEFIPALSASRYISVPLAAASTSFPSVPFALQPELGRIAVYPIDSNRDDGSTADNPIYDVDDGWGIISPAMHSASNALESASGSVNVVLASSHRFPIDSPSQRYFIVDNPVSFCMNNGNLFRYQGYGFSVQQPGAASGALNVLSEPERVLLASDIVMPLGVTDHQFFRYQASSLQRNGLVLFDFYVQDQDLTVSDATQEDIRVQFEVQVRNVP